MICNTKMERLWRVLKLERCEFSQSAVIHLKRFNFKSTPMWESTQAKPKQKGGCFSFVVYSNALLVYRWFSLHAWWSDRCMTPTTGSNSIKMIQKNNPLIPNRKDPLIFKTTHTETKVCGHTHQHAIWEVSERTIHIKRHFFIAHRSKHIKVSKFPPKKAT